MAGACLMYVTRDDTQIALRWTPVGKRKRGRPKITWRKTVEHEPKQMGLSWGEAQATAKNRDKWKEVIAAALCPTGGYKD